MFHLLQAAGYKAVAFLVLPFLMSGGNAAHVAAVRNPSTHPVVAAAKSTIPLRAPAVQGGCYTTLTFSGPTSVPMNGWATYWVNNWNGRCVLWYYNGSYVTTYNGSLSIQFVNGSPGMITALQHSDCSPGGPVYACGNIFLSFY